MEDAVPVLRRTPGTLDALLRGLGPTWTQADEGPGTWTPPEVVAHLSHADRTNWLPRLHTILHGDGTFPPFDRFAHLAASGGRTPDDLLDEFAAVRRECVTRLETLRLTAADLRRTGHHPEFGKVTAGQLLATWVAHDLDHVVQIARTLAGVQRNAVGPWQAYLRVLR
ncbi:hypothetical protein GCM10017781_16550 [Deinococcus metalli]|uniref:DinB-like domain-containing protein n=1 Tax=Deinococcus metalli TaxID=1141878 RepID=A0ABQ3JLD7_9DEIO|nr:hypothetical protein GCM10017781_16550 [Deinococcus metalli]